MYDGLLKSFVSVVRGHDNYKSVWAPPLEERLSLHPEPGNNHDKHTVSVETATNMEELSAWSLAAVVNRVALSFSWRPGA